MELHCVYVNTIKSPQMSTWFNLFHSGRQLNWISPKWLSISCLCVTSGYGCRGIQTHSLIHLTPISHLAQSKWLHIFQKLKKKKIKKCCIKIKCMRVKHTISDFELEVFFLLWNLYVFLQEYLFSVSRPYLVFGVTARWGPGLIQACQWHSIAQQLLVAVTPWPAFPLRCE